MDNLKKIKKMINNAEIGIEYDIVKFSDFKYFIFEYFENEGYFWSCEGMKKINFSCLRRRGEDKKYNILYFKTLKVAKRDLINVIQNEIN